MYCYVDESGNTGSNLFDEAQPALFYGVLTSKLNLDVAAEGKPLSQELALLFNSQAKRGRTDEVSLAGLDRRWRHLVELPEPDEPLPVELQEIFERYEQDRLNALKGL